MQSCSQLSLHELIHLFEVTCYLPFITLPFCILSFIRLNNYSALKESRVYSSETMNKVSNNSAEGCGSTAAADD